MELFYCCIALVEAVVCEFLPTFTATMYCSRSSWNGLRGTSRTPKPLVYYIDLHIPKRSDRADAAAASVLGLRKTRDEDSSVQQGDARRTSGGATRGEESDVGNETGCREEGEEEEEEEEPRDVLAVCKHGDSLGIAAVSGVKTVCSRVGAKIWQKPHGRIFISAALSRKETRFRLHSPVGPAAFNVYEWT